MNYYSYLQEYLDVTNAQISIINQLLIYPILEQIHLGLFKAFSIYNFLLLVWLPII